MVLILYILCEDSGAGKKFISDFIKCAGIPDHYVTILTSNGNLGLNHSYATLQYELLANDLLVLLIDCVAVTDSFDAFSFIARVKKDCSRKGVSLWLPNYYCFEEIFLSFDDLLTLNRHSFYQKRLYEIHSVLTQNSVSWDSNQFWPENREKECKQILAATSNSIKLIDFKITGNHFGKCWLINCSDIADNRKPYVCWHCTYCQHKALQYFETHSILKFNSLLSFVSTSRYDNEDDSHHTGTTNLTSF